MYIYTKFSHMPQCFKFYNDWLKNNALSVQLYEILPFAAILHIVTKLHETKFHDVLRKYDSATMAWNFIKFSDSE